jgi:hypothetical protein
MPSSPGRRVIGDGFDLLDPVFHRIEARVPAQAVDGLEAAGGHEPRTRVRRHAVTRPLFQRRPERVVQRLLGEIEIPEQAN